MPEQRILEGLRIALVAHPMIDSGNLSSVIAVSMRRHGLAQRERSARG